MKVEIDLNEILGDETGAETLNESIKRQLLESLKSEFLRTHLTVVEETIQKTIAEIIESEGKKLLPQLINDLVDKEYTVVGKWGDKDETTTFRKQLLKTLSEKMVYKERNAYGSRNSNYFTETVDNIIDENLKEFKKDFNKLVDEKYKEETINYAVNKLKKSLNID